VVLGVRPEHVLFADADTAPGPELSATVEAIEPTGSEVHVVFQWGPHQLIARVAPRPLPEPGAQLKLRLAAQHLHFFSADADGRRIGPPD
jgi:multiple sugar transport system ATP-binding protein